MSAQEHVDKIVDTAAAVAENVAQNVSSSVSKPGLSGAFIAGSMVIGGGAVVFRGVCYLIGYIKAEKNFVGQ